MSDPTFPDRDDENSPPQTTDSASHNGSVAERSETANTPPAPGEPALPEALPDDPRDEESLRDEHRPTFQLEMESASPSALPAYSRDPTASSKGRKPTFRHQFVYVAIGNLVVPEANISPEKRPGTPRPKWIDPVTFHESVLTMNGVQGLLAVAPPVVRARKRGPQFDVVEGFETVIAVRRMACPHEEVLCIVDPHRVSLAASRKAHSTERLLLGLSPRALEKLDTLVDPESLDFVFDARQGHRKPIPFLALILNLAEKTVRKRIGHLFLPVRRRGDGS